MQIEIVQQENSTWTVRLIPVSDQEYEELLRHCMFHQYRGRRDFLLHLEKVNVNFDWKPESQVCQNGTQIESDSN